MGGDASWAQRVYTAKAFALCIILFPALVIALSLVRGVIPRNATMFMVWGAGAVVWAVWACSIPGVRRALRASTRMQPTRPCPCGGSLVYIGTANTARYILGNVAADDPIIHAATHRWYEAQCTLWRCRTCGETREMVETR